MSHRAAGDEGALALARHLQREARGLQGMLALLDEEAIALRRLDREALERLAAAKSEQLVRHADRAAALAGALQALCPARPPSTLRQAVDLLPQGLGREALIGEAGALKVLVERVAAGHRRNQAFAEAGRALVGGLLRRLGGGQAEAYRADGRAREGLAAGAVVQGRA